MSETQANPTARAQMRKTLPRDTFERQSQRGWYYVPLVLSIVGISIFMVSKDLPWLYALPLALVLGQLYSMMAFLAHEALHGAIAQSPKLQNLMGHLGFGVFLISPHLWRVWHNQVHHAHSNSGDKDPDSFGTLKRYEKYPWTRLLLPLVPGSKSWLSYLFLGYWFTFHGQIVLWVEMKLMKAFQGADRKPAIRDTFLYAAFWIGLGVWIGAYHSLFVIIIPMIVANFTLMSYIATNHFLRPQTEKNEPLTDSMSVTTHPLIDVLHFNFSYHVEHHFFPSMSPKHAPRVRDWLVKNYPDQYLAPSHWKAIKCLYQTPRLYIDSETLGNFEQTEKIEVSKVTEWLRRPEQENLHTLGSKKAPSPL